MIDNWFRSRLPSVTVRLLSLYRMVGLTPNGVSWLAFVLACVASVFVARGQLMMALVVWWLGRLADGTDGIYARAEGCTTAYGAYLDIVLDMAGYSLMIVGFSVLFPGLIFMWMSILVLYVLCITSALALGQAEDSLGKVPKDNRGLRYGAGLAEAGETGIAYSIFLLFPGALGVTVPIWIAVLFFTVLARTVLARRVLLESID